MMKRKGNAMIFLVLCGFLLAAGGRRDEETGNVSADPVNRYNDAYKAYLDAPCPVGEDGMKHFAYFARDREAVKNHPFLDISRFDGAQIMYSWKQLEPLKGVYDFSVIREDYSYLSDHGKKLFIQLQDATFDPGRKAVPDYLLSPEYDGGAVYQRNDDDEPEGWVAKRWNPRVQERFALLLEALGEEFDGRVEGVNLQESAIGVSSEYDHSFSPEIYRDSLKKNMLALKKAFPQSVVIQYANFMPGEWLPRDDRGYLRSLYEYGEEIGVGLGGPDLMVQRRAQLNHTIAMMHEGTYTVPLGIAVQDGNYVGKTGADGDFEVGADSEERENLVPLLHDFAGDFLRVTYMFWSYQEPYFTENVIPGFTS